MAYRITPFIVPLDWRGLYFILMSSAVFCGDEPKETIFPTAIAILCFFLLFMLWIVNAKLKKDISSVGLLLFLCCVLISLPLSLGNDISARDWLLRGVAPVLFLATYFFLPIRNQNDARFVINTLIFVCFLWAAKVGYLLFVDIDRTLLSRWTAITRDLIFPYNLIAICILLIDKNFSLRTRIFGIFIFSLITIGAGYRIQILIMSLFVCFYLLRSLLRRQYFFPILVISILMGGFITFATTEAGTALISRFSEIKSEADSGRVKEIQFAYEKFLESPVLGNGLAYPIPLTVTFYGRDDYVRAIARQQSGTYDHVTYMHNIIMYILMSLGIFGLLSFLSFIAGTILKFSRYDGPRILVSDDRVACLSALFSILAFTLAAATFTLFQYNLLLSSLIAVLTARHWGKHD